MNLARRALGALIVVLSVSPASANDHFARVNEVLISIGGDTTKQLLEIEDTANEAFSGGGYTLFVYGADGSTQVHNQVLALSPGVTRITLATSAAFTQFGLATKTTPPNLILNLGETLPAAATACFRKSGTDLHCMSWGLVTLPSQSPTNGRVGGPAPIDGMSVQRQATGNCAGNGTPTADAVNATVPCMDPPTMGGPDAGPGADGGVTGDGGTNPPMGSDDSCSASGSGSWFGVLATLGLVGLLRRRRR
jgi:uncharacterized protein (TIGR03382 family)